MTDDPNVRLTSPARVLAGIAGMALLLAVGRPAAMQTTAKKAPAPAPAKAAPTGKKALTDTKSLAAGKAIFERPTSLCITCHRNDLGGVVGPNLTDGFWLHGCSVNELMKSVRGGYPVQGMLPYGGGPALSETEVHQVVSYILSKRGSAPPRPKPRDPARDKPCT